MFVLEILVVESKPLYVLRTPQGNPVLSTFDVGEVSQKLSDVSDNILNTMKPKEE